MVEETAAAARMLTAEIARLADAVATFTYDAVGSAPRNSSRAGISVRHPARLTLVA